MNFGGIKIIESVDVPLNEIHMVDSRGRVEISRIGSAGKQSEGISKLYSRMEEILTEVAPRLSRDDRTRIQLFIKDLWLPKDQELDLKDIILQEKEDQIKKQKERILKGRIYRTLKRKRRTWN